MSSELGDFLPGKYCAGCGGSAAGSCAGALASRGVRTVHWECWSRCNVHCPFCYRTRSTPLHGERAELLLHALTGGGITTLAFAGGDPSLRRDLPRLCEIAQSLGLVVEVQTNAHTHSEFLLRALDHVDSVALSLDSGVPNIHDHLRATPGNFRQNLALLQILEARGVPTRVRTVVTTRGSDSVALLGRVLTEFTCVTAWSLHELSAVGDGMRVHGGLHLPRHEFDRVAEEVRHAHPTLACTVVTSASKIGLYAMVRSDGELYGTADPLESDGFYPTVGNILDQHLSTLAARLPFDADAHARRYVNLSPSSTQ